MSQKCPTLKGLPINKKALAFFPVIFKHYFNLLSDLISRLFFMYLILLV